MTENENSVMAEAVYHEKAVSEGACAPVAPVSTQTPENADAQSESADGAVVDSASEINRRNAALTTGSVTDDGRGAVFFTAADVRAMSREQVRANLPKILKSMESPEF